MPALLRRPGGPRRGVTLVEMLVVVALVVLMMTILVQIFASATGAMSASRAVQELDVSLRQVDVTLRQDLLGATARFTPPLDPKNNLGYFEYMENAHADDQGEDTDDILAFTTRAPEGQYFTGRQWLIDQVNISINQGVQPTTITSQVAEVIYFVRNGNLYRRTFLVVPDRAKSITTGVTANNVFPTTMFGGSMNATWLGMNEISARPAGFFPPPTPADVSQRNFTPILNTLGDLTNRENRAFRPRFANDFGRPTDTSGKNPDSFPDDFNVDSSGNVIGDDIPDYYPTLYYDGVGKTYPGGAGWAPNSHVNEGLGYGTNMRVKTNPYDVYAFPFIYPGMYSVPDPDSVKNGQGWLHSLKAYADPGTSFNHGPLENVDNLAVPASPGQTWFGFPTWRETMSGLRTGTTTINGWTDPINFITNNSNMQPAGLNPFDPTAAPSLTSTNFPPPVTIPGTLIPPFRFDGAGSNLMANTLAPGAIWEDDLILTNVRSFDVKAYDPDAPSYSFATGTLTATNLPTGYYDLGHASRLNSDFNGGLVPATYSGNSVYFFQPKGEEPKGFLHEGRIPPLTTDFRAKPLRVPQFRATMASDVTITTHNAGDNHAGVPRLRRVFDTWSTDYTNAPETDIFLNGYAPNPPIYPSFPPPYPSALRGIQIQIRVTDPRGERVKVLTIRQDFTDKL